MRKSIFLVILAIITFNGANASLPAGLVTDSKDWANGQNSSHYVIQLMSAKKEKYLLSAGDIEAIKEVDPLTDLVYHPKEAKGTVWHTVIWGPFSSRDDAKNVHAQLSPKWTKNAPWVRKISSLKFLSANASTPTVAAPAPVTPITPLPAPAPERIKRTIPRQPVKSTPLVYREPDPTPEATAAIEAAMLDPYSQDDAPFHGTIDYHLPRQGTYPYIKLGAGSFTAESELTTLQPTEYSGTAAEVALGLDVGYYLGVELGYVTLSSGEADINGVADSVANDIDTEFDAIKYSALFKLPFDGLRRWQAFAQVGFIDWELTANQALAGATTVTPTTSSGTDLFYGGGLEYKFSKQFAFGLKHQIYDLENLDTSSSSAEFTWRWEGRN